MAFKVSDLHGELTYITLARNTAQHLAIIELTTIQDDILLRDVYLKDVSACDVWSEECHLYAKHLVF